MSQTRLSFRFFIGSIDAPPSFGTDKHHLHFFRQLLVGTTAADKVETGPRASLVFITKLLCESKLCYDYYDITEDDDTVSKLLSGSQNIAPDIVRAAATIDLHLVEQYFEREIIHRLNPNKKKHIVLALKELILTDSDIEPETQLGTLSNMTAVVNIATMSVKSRGCRKAAFRVHYG